MAEDHVAPETGNSSLPKPEVVKGQRVAKEQAAQRVRSWTGQNAMRSVPNRMTANAA